MADQYRVEFSVTNPNPRHGYHEILDSEELELKLGHQELMKILIASSRGHREVIISAEVRKYP